MPEKRLRTIITCLFFPVVIFAQTASKVDSTGMMTLRIDPKSARGASISQLFDDVKFIPLETTKESLFGSINQLEIVDGNFVIHDWDTKAILIFNTNGKFKTKINAANVDTDKDPGQKETSVIYGFTVRQEGGVFYVIINSSKYVYYFDLNGKRIKKVLVKEFYANGESIKFADSVTEVRKNYLLKKGADSTFYEIGLLTNNQPTSLYFPYNENRYKEDQFFGDAIVNYGVPNELFYTRSCDFNIYKITPRKLSLAYRVILPATNSLPQDFLTNPIYKNKRFEFFDKNKDIYYSIGSTYKMGNNLFFKMRSWSYNRDKKNALIYDLQTSDLISISDIQPDTMSCFLPITDAGVYYDFMNHGFLLHRDGYLYTSYSSLAMFAFKEQSAGKNPVYNAILSNYFKTESKQSNPVIIAVKPKKG